MPRAEYRVISKTEKAATLAKGREIINKQTIALVT